MNFYDAWNFLVNHPIFNNRFSEELYIAVAKVNPKTMEVDDDFSKNTKVQIWLEHGEYEKEYNMCRHNIDLDCGGDTYEEAIIEMARLVKEKFTNDGKKLEK